MCTKLYAHRNLINRIKCMSAFNELGNFSLNNDASRFLFSSREAMYNGKINYTSALLAYGFFPILYVYKTKSYLFSPQFYSTVFCNGNRFIFFSYGRVFYCFRVYVCVILPVISCMCVIEGVYQSLSIGAKSHKWKITVIFFRC